MILDDKIRVRLDDFDGPLALLLQLIKREEMDIRELDINLITKNYLEYIFKIQKRLWGFCVCSAESFEDFFVLVV